MNYQVKQQLFSSFLAEWDYKFKKTLFILKYLESYPELCAKLKNFKPLQSEKVMESQLEWVSLIAQFDHPLDQEFFKSYWVSIQNDDYDFFIDLSSDTFAIFEIHYFWTEPYKWYKKHLFKDIAELLTSVDDDTINIEQHLKDRNKEWFTQLNDFFFERNLLGVENKILPEAIDINYATKTKEETACNLLGNVLVFQGVYSDFIGLLAFDIEITVQKFEPRRKRIIELIQKVNTIGGLIFLLQAYGSKKDISYRISFNNNQDSFAKFRDHILTIKHSDQTMLQGLAEKYERFVNSPTPD